MEIPKRQMEPWEMHLMWNFLNEVWWPTYHEKYSDKVTTLEWWMNKGPDFARLVEEIYEIMKTDSTNLNDKHKYILNSFIKTGTKERRKEFMKVYNEYRASFLA